MPQIPKFSAQEVGQWLQRLYIDAEYATLRDEDRRKAVEVAALLDEVAREVGRIGKARDLCLVDAASGKSYLGLLAAKLVLEPTGRTARVVCIERNAAFVAHTKRATSVLASAVPIVCQCAELAQANAWPQSPSIVVGLHACGNASDEIIAQAITASARTVLLVPCCVGVGVARVKDAEALADQAGIPRAAPIRRRYVHALIESDRLLTLEAAGYQTEAVEFVAPTITPYNTLLRARRVGEANRMAKARDDLARLWRSADVAAALS
jgi:hypothetical protein